MCAATDLTIVAAAWMGAYALRFQTELFPAAPVRTAPHLYAQLLLAILPIWYLLLHARGLYRFDRRRSWLQESASIVGANTLGTLLLVSLSFFAEMHWLSRLTVALFWIASSLSLVAGRHVVRRILVSLHRTRRTEHRVLVVGTGRLAREVNDRLSLHQEMGLRTIGFVGPEHIGLDRCATPWLGPYSHLRAIVEREGVDQVVIALDRADPEDPLKLLHELYDTPASIRFVPDLLGPTTLRAGVEDLDGLPMVRIVDDPMVGWRRIVKRGIDIAVSTFGLVLGAPFFGSIALGVKLSSPGPIFFGQERVSLDGRPFRMWKFRTMVENAEEQTGPVWADRDDPRCTRFGAFLRRRSLDELPQLWNVLKGEMSLVGPRPERPEFIAQFRQQIPGYMLRHRTKGGMTGLAQVSGLRGNTSVERRLELDMEYLERWSLSMDLKVLLLTLLRAFRDPNAY